MNNEIKEKLILDTIDQHTDILKKMVETAELLRDKINELEDIVLKMQKYMISKN